MVPVGIKNIYPFVCIAALVAVAFAVFGGTIFRHGKLPTQIIGESDSSDADNRLKVLGYGNEMPPIQLNAAPLYVKAASEVDAEVIGSNSDWLNIMESGRIPVGGDYAILEKETVHDKAIFAVLDAARRKPKCVFDINTRLLAADDNDHLARGLRGLALLITARSYVLAHRGDVAEAVHNEGTILEFIGPFKKSEPMLAYEIVYSIFNDYYRGLHNISVIAGEIKSRRPS